MRVPRGDSCPGAADEPMCFVRDGLQCKDGACAPLDPDGSACSVSWLCASGHCFFPEFGTGVGICRTPAPFDACGDDDDCPPEHFCRRLPNGMVDGGIVEGAVRCEPRFPTGTACPEDRECASNNCSAGVPHPAVDLDPEGVCLAEPWIAACGTFVVYPFIP